jgi:hypothetical protein
MLLFFALWGLVGFPRSLAAITLMERVPVRRLLLGIGLADMFLLAACLSQNLKGTGVKPWPRWALIASMVAWLAFLGCAAFQMPVLFPGYPAGRIVTAGLITACIGCSFFFVPRVGMLLLVLVSLYSSIGFNPLVRGGTAFIRENTLSRRIVELDRALRAEGESPLWAVYGDSNRDIPLPNLPRMIGVHALNGVHPYPQERLWSVLDPAGKYRDIWNRYAHVTLVLPDRPGEPEMFLVQQDVVCAALHPQSAAFEKLGVDFILYDGSHGDLFGGLPNLRFVFEHAGKSVYEVVRPR